MAFQGVDFYGIDELLTDEELVVRDTVRSFGEERLLPGVAQHFRNGTFPVDMASTLR